MIFKFFLLSLTVASVFGQYVHDGECRTDVEVVQNFDVAKYLGKWYEVQRYEVYFQRGSECSQALYTKAEDSSVIVENSSIKNGEPRSIAMGTAILVDPTADPLLGKLSVAFNHQKPGATANYNILDTDYENYSIVWNCQSMRNGKSADVAWVLSRTPILNADVESKVNEIVDKYLVKEKLRTTDQSAETCGY